MSTPFRPSASLVQFFGAELVSRLRGGSVSNTFNSSRGDERTAPGAVTRLTGGVLEPSSVNANQFDLVRATLQRSGAAPSTLDALAMSVLDVAAILQTDVMNVLAVTDNNTIQMLENKAFIVMNRLRDPSSTLDSASEVDNQQSLLSREINFLLSEPRPPAFDWSWDCELRVGNGTALQTRRVSFSGDGTLLASASDSAQSPVLLTLTPDWNTHEYVGAPVSSPARISSLHFEPRERSSHNLLAVGFTGTNDGMQVLSMITGQPVTASPSPLGTNWVRWNPSATLLAAVHATDPTASATVTIWSRSNWNVAFEAQYARNQALPITGAWSHDGRWLALFCASNTQARLRILDAHNGYVEVRNVALPVGTLTYGGAAPVLDWDLTHRNVIVPPGSEFQSSDVQVYDIQTNVMRTIPVTLEQAIAARILPTGDRVVITGRRLPVGSPNRSPAVLVDTQTWQQVRVIQDLSTQADIYTQADWTRNGEWLVMADYTTESVIGLPILTPVPCPPAAPSPPTGG